MRSWRKFSARKNDMPEPMIRQRTPAKLQQPSKSKVLETRVSFASIAVLSVHRAERCRAYRESREFAKGLHDLNLIVSRKNGLCFAGLVLGKI